jgi:CPA1 family monovalent cation:H+ antiporter
MSIFQIATTLICLAALFSYINHRFVRLPSVIGVMAIALIGSVVVIALGGIAQPVRAHVAAIVSGIDFSEALLHGMLAFLLFAGAMHLDLNDLKGEWGPIVLLAALGTVVSTFLIGLLSYYALHWMGCSISWIEALLFGALISPTDPIAVLGIIQRVGVPKRIETVITGESLFNDGVGVVMFIVLIELAQAETHVTITSVATLLAQEVVGGAVLGLVLGFIVFRQLRRVDAYKVEVLLTLALAMGSYALADALHFSAPIAAVVAGLLIGNTGRALAMSKETEQRLDTFWELLDEILNAVLFLLIGLEVLVMPFSARYVYAGAAAILIALFGRWLTVGSIGGLIRLRRTVVPGAVTILTWGGLRGGISVALALSLPQTDQRNLIIAITYAVVVFSILIQGLTVERVVRRITRAHSKRVEADTANVN